MSELITERSYISTNGCSLFQDATLLDAVERWQAPLAAIYYEAATGGPEARMVNPKEVAKIAANIKHTTADRSIGTMEGGEQ